MATTICTVCKSLDAASAFISYPDYVDLLARVHLSSAQMSPAGAVKDRHLGAADALFSEAARKRPADPAVWKGWALLDLERGRYDQALEKVDTLAALDENIPEVAALRKMIRERLANR